MPWEILVAMANESGKDLYINIPSNASLDYINKLADLMAFGSNGVNPYTQRHQTRSGPLNSNLKLYIEFSNEIWNSGFVQAGTQGYGWCNQLSQRAVYDYLTDNQNDPLYPGGGANAYNDGAILLRNASIARNEAGWLASYNPNPPVQAGSYSPGYFSNPAGLDGFGIYNTWAALRLEQISMAFKTTFQAAEGAGGDELAIDAAATGSRVRTLYEWQYGGSWDYALSNMVAMFGSQHPVDYYLYGGGGGWYSDNTNDGFDNVTAKLQFRQSRAEFRTIGGQRPVGHERRLDVHRQRGHRRQWQQPGQRHRPVERPADYRGWRQFLQRQHADCLHASRRQRQPDRQLQRRLGRPCLLRQRDRQ